MVLLDVNNLTAYYDSVRALDDISICVDEGEIIALIGPNGAGKSTTLKVICGLLKARSGDILFRGKRINGCQPNDLVKEGLCLVPEGRRVFPSMTVQENLEMGACACKKKGSFESTVGKVLSLFPVLGERKKQRAGTLSGGEQQMLAIGRALMFSPRLLLLDEPSLGLSPKYIEIVFEKLREINAAGTTMLLVEQNVRMALEYADRGYVFEIGRIALQGSAKELLEDADITRRFLEG